jgi:hypothetical protein
VLTAQTKFPVVAQPPKKLGEHWAGGLGNGNTTLVLDGFRSAARRVLVRCGSRSGRAVLATLWISTALLPLSKPLSALTS